MSTRINTNTTAFEAARNLSNNSDKLSRNIQRLSSGLRINSAADDAAGLVISESLQAQSAGLAQATNNTNDAINVVKTAEGALNEVQSLLISVRQTIIQAANVGSSNPTALQADKDAIAAAITSINRITGSTQFNGKNLLDGSASAGGTAITSGAATVVPTNSQTATLGLVSEAIQYGTTALSGAAVTYTQSKQAVYTVPGNGVDALSNASTFTGTLNVNGTTITLGTTPQTLDQLNTALEATGSTYQASVSNGALKFTDSTATGGPSAGATGFSASGLKYASAATPLAYSAVGTGVLADGNVASVTVTKPGGAAYTSNSVTTSPNGTNTYNFTTGAFKGLQLSSNATAASLPVVTGTGTAAAIYSVTSQAKNYGATAISAAAVTYAAAVASTATSATSAAAVTGDILAGSLVVDGVTVTVPVGTLDTGLGAIISAATGKTITAVINGSNQVVLSDASGATISANFTNLSDTTHPGAGTFGAATIANGHGKTLTVNGQTSSSATVSGPNTVFSFNGGALDGLVLTGATASLGNTTFSATADTPPAAVGTLSSTADKVAVGNALQFQIGANAGQTVSVSIGNTKANAIGNYTDTATGTSYTLSDLLASGGLNVTDPTGKAQEDALAVVDQALSDISVTREQLGSVQSNVFQSNLNTLGIAQQNTDASTSTIRDTNLSSEIVDYTKNQILVQAGTSALAYANQAPQAILKLLQ